MSSSYKVALALDSVDYNEEIAAAIKDVAVFARGIDFSDVVETPDNKHVLLYWDDIDWENPCIQPLLDQLKEIRHALATVNLDTCEVRKDIKSSDSRGVDEEFDEILGVRSDILYSEWGKRTMTPLAKEAEFVVPIPRERLIQLLKDYMSWDIYGIGNAAVFYDNLIGIGFEHAEIEALGFGYCIPDEEKGVETGISEIVNKAYPKMLRHDGSFIKKSTFNIGFHNPNEASEDDGVANDETQFEAASLYDLIYLYCDFCDENNIPYDTVKYVELVEEV